MILIVEKIVLVLGDFSLLIWLTFYAVLLNSIIKSQGSKRVSDLQKIILLVSLEWLVKTVIQLVPSADSIITPSTRTAVSIIVCGSTVWILGIVFTYNKASKDTNNDLENMILCVLNGVFLVMWIFSVLL